MLGKYVRITVTKPIHTKNKQYGFEYLLNFGVLEGAGKLNNDIFGAYIMGMSKPVRSFDGRVVAVIKRAQGGRLLVVAPRTHRYIKSQILRAVNFAEKYFESTVDCLYEHSCGALVFRNINNEMRFLLIKNKRSMHWGFPKGHIEGDETPEETAKREVLEETGIHIEIISDYSLLSRYMIQGKVEKCVTIFIATTADSTTVIQREEIEDYIWLNYDRAMDSLRFENDKRILRKANEYLLEHGYIYSASTD